MERRRSQQQRFKEQQRISISQQDLTSALSRMKTVTIGENQRTVRSASSSIERLTNPSVSQLIKEFEARAHREDLLPSVNDRIYSNCRQMTFSSTVSQIKDESDHPPIVNRNVCSRNSHRTENDTIEERADFSSSSSMATRSTDLDEAAAASRSNVEFDKNQLNNALADLISISNDFEKIRPKNQISTSIELLNDFIDKFESETKIKEKTRVCGNCQELFANNEQIVNATGQFWHSRCFVCAQCFQPFDDGLFFEHEGRKYCQRDFQMLFAPMCAECEKPIVGRVIRAMGKSFHPNCFRCQTCRTALIDIGFLKFNEKAFCRSCYNKEKSNEKTCSKCHQTIRDNFLKYNGEFYHSHHFSCSNCGDSLNENHSELRGYFYCSKCFENVDLPVCAGCHRVIEDRVVEALGKNWHSEHFSCARCARPFYGNEHYEHDGLAYCQFDHQKLFGSTCFVCNKTIFNGAYSALNKKFCAEHFSCSICEKKLNVKSKFYDVDATVVCKKCFQKLPSTSRKSSQDRRSRRPLLRQTSV